MYFYQYLKAWLGQFENEEGQGMAEYALILVLIAVVVIVALGLLGTQISTIMGDVTKGLTPT